ncbi:MAG TPA: DUF4062 domain-containing protein [Gammaproteobacteria bacterium]|nr:DUF4062 domain-containing protein [Gammaproteobacteria bacterium]
MRVFISSVIKGFEDFRETAVDAAEALDHTIIQAEDFAASPKSARVTCLEGVRAADVVLILLGARYGETQSSGKSATHEEFDEARRSKSVFVFVQGGITPEPKQAALISEAQSWASGQHTARFNDAEELRRAVVKGTAETSQRHPSNVRDASERTFKNI